MECRRLYHTGPTDGAKVGGGHAKPLQGLVERFDDDRGPPSPRRLVCGVEADRQLDVRLGHHLDALEILERLRRLVSRDTKLVASSPRKRIRKTRRGSQFSMSNIREASSALR
jgi:hypothetical protein